MQIWDQVTLPGQGVSCRKGPSFSAEQLINNTIPSGAGLLSMEPTSPA